jgi:putative tricarboxylic transport membrane protein
MNIRSRLPEIILAGLFLILSCWYLNDAYSASASTENLLLILPAAIVVICLCLWIIGRALYEVTRAGTDQAGDEEEKEKKSVSVFGAMSILAGFVLSMDWIGFDAATFLFMIALMFLQGERRPLWLSAFPAVFAILVSLFFEYMIPYPMPMLLGKEFLEKLI